MPRITKAEVRASVAEAKKKEASKKTKEEFLRAKEAKEKQPYPVITEGTIASTSDKESTVGADEAKTDIEAVSTEIKNHASATTKRVNISNYDPTLINPRVTKTQMVAINRKEIEEARENMSEMEDKLQEANAIILDKEGEIADLQNELREMMLDKDTLQDSYEKKIAESNEKYNKMLLEKNGEISDLNAELLIAQKALEEKNLKEAEKKNLISPKAQKIIAYLFYIIFSTSIMILIGMLIVKGFSALIGWLF